MGFGGGGSSGAAVPPLQLGAEQELGSAPVDTAFNTIGADIFRTRIAALTIPATAAFWIVSKVIAKNGATVLGTMQAGCIRLMDSTMTLVPVEMVAIGAPVAQAGADAEQTYLMLHSMILSAGDKVSPFINNNSTGTLRTIAAAASNQGKPQAQNIQCLGVVNTAAWNNSTLDWYIRLFIKPVLV